MWPYFWPDSSLLSPLGGFLRVRLDCEIRWRCFPGLNWSRFSCLCGYRQSLAKTFLRSRGQAHPSIVKHLSPEVASTCFPSTTDSDSNSLTSAFHVLVVELQPELNLADVAESRRREDLPKIRIVAG